MQLVISEELLVDMNGVVRLVIGSIVEMLLVIMKICMVSVKDRLDVMSLLQELWDFSVVLKLWEISMVNMMSMVVKFMRLNFLLILVRMKLECVIGMIFGWFWFKLVLEMLFEDMLNNVWDNWYLLLLQLLSGFRKLEKCS